MKPQARGRNVRASICAVLAAGACCTVPQYVLHFPKGEKYVSILKSSDEPELQAQIEVGGCGLTGGVCVGGSGRRCRGPGGLVVMMAGV